MPIRPGFLSREGRTRAAAAMLVVAGGCLCSSACLRRDVSSQQPTTKISFEASVSQPAIDKIDLLVLVDNSSSMADKQRILADAVPDLVSGLVRPKCVDKVTRAPTEKFADPTAPPQKMCPAGSEPAFVPVTDMHIGVLSSSLGGFGSASCQTSGADGRPHNDDRGHLLARGPEGKDVEEAGELHFLAWYPDVESNRDKIRHPDPPVPKIGDLDHLSTAFRNLVVGVGQDGCGLEAQLESVYHFLIQPDPWESIEIDNSSGTDKATYGPPGTVDVELLRQRAAFLRPDSLVAVLVLTDEDDSSVDPLSFQGTGWIFMEDNDGIPRATRACQTTPASSACTACPFASTDPECVEKGNYYNKKENESPLNVRFHRMKQRFGVDPQFPIQRYVDGFKSSKVPRRSAEHDEGGRYRPGAACTNPLYAARLPENAGDELCKLARGPRTDASVYFALIGGVPHQLLPDDPDNPDLEPDWTRIVGRDPSRWDESDLDPHMIQSIEPRPGLPGPDQPDDADPIHGREWATGGDDLQYACIFDLYERDETGKPKPVRRACPAGSGDCDCDGSEHPPLCAANEPTIQVKGKSYPTRRELLVAKGLGTSGIVASLCPKQLFDPALDSYGYRPAVRAITRRLESGRIASCVPRPLTRNEDGNVSCVIAAILPDAGPDSECQSRYGLGNPRPEVMTPLREKLIAEEGEGARNFPICEVPQLEGADPAACLDEEEKTGFCYVDRPAGAGCNQALVFTKPARKLAGARFTMQCILVTENGN